MNKKNSNKKIVHIFIMFMIIASLIIGIVFSLGGAINDNKLGSRFNGGYEALVGVYNNTKEQDDNENLPNGDSDEGARALEKKLSPFSDNTIEVTKTGNSRLTVRASKDAYSNNENFFVDAIEQNGGLVILNSAFEDVLFDSTIMKKIDKTVLDGEGNVTDKVKISEIVGNVKAEAVKVGTSNQPFLNFDISETEYLSKIVAASETEQTPVLNMITSIETLLNNLRGYYNLGTTEDEMDDYVSAYWNGLISPLQTAYNKLSTKEQNVLDDFFGGTYITTGTTGLQVENVVSLMDQTKIKSEQSLKSVLFQYENGKINTNKSFKFLNTNIGKYIYDPNSIAEDFMIKDGKKGKYYDNLKVDAKLNKPSRDMGNIREAFKVLTSNLLGKALFKDIKAGSKVNQYFDEKVFDDYILLTETINPATNVNSKAYIDTDANRLMVRSETYTKSKKTEATILQTTLGITFKVLSVSEFDMDITAVMFIVSVVFLIIIALAIMGYLIFAYRLLGLFASILAFLAASLTLLVPVWFTLAIGPEIITSLIIVVGLVLDASFIYFESIKKNIYKDKHSIESSFKIAGKETLWLGIDAALVTLIPNVALFWIGSGALKNFATITSLGVMFALVFGIIVLRFMSRIVINTKWFKKYDWLLPIDTSQKIKSTFFNDFFKKHYESKLEKLTSKDSLSSEQLIKIKKIKDKVSHYSQKERDIIAKKNAAFIKKAEAKIAKFEKQNKSLKETKFKSLNKLINSRKDQNNFNKNYYEVKLANDNPEEIQVNEMIKLERKVFKTGKIMAVIGVFMIAIGAIVGFTAGPNLTSSFGKGNKFVLYGSTIDDTYESLSNNGQIQEWVFDPNSKLVQEIIDLKANSDQKNIQKLKDQGIMNINRPEELQGDQYLEARNEWKASVVADFYEFIIFNNHLTDFVNYKESVGKLANVQIKYGPDFKQTGISLDKLSDVPYVSIQTTSSVEFGTFKAWMRRIADNGKQTPTSAGGILGLSESPFTAYGQIKEVAIMFGIILLALLVYMIIRFKWTYYVALALGFVFITAITVASVIIFRVPVTAEIIAAVVGVMSFAVITAILILGKGKSIISSKTDERINEYFNKEIELAVEIKEYKNTINDIISSERNQYANKINDLKVKLKDIDDKKSDDYKKVKVEMKSLRNEFRIFRKVEKQKFKDFKAKNKKAIKLESKTNNFAKEVFLNVTKFAITKTVFISSIYAIVAIVMALTLPSIVGMGITLVIGIVTTSVVTITIVVPIWIWLERQRISAKYGYKRFIRKIKVSEEEQIIKDIND
ncbi:protein translocase SecDF, variant type [[Acholeplasma] multilocale]|uniref:protein translocase SecDF, variant type n=1 Tax=[Acholeplasma] multilocale TaxID=264638 RepID=UPI000478ABA6|nr:protein translocase SecDF, variant type [[Acholeplasma] multilocale]